MNLTFNKYFITFIFTGLILILSPTYSYAEGISNINKIFVVTQQKTTINYEKSQPSSIDNPVVDPNFNVMRSSDGKLHGYIYSYWFINCCYDYSISNMVVLL